MKLMFEKYHGCGNDFIIIDNRSAGFKPTAESVKLLCDRHFGVGADGLMLFEDDRQGSDFYMDYFNADGSGSTMCGNGGRAIALFAHHKGIGSNVLNFRGSDGLHRAQLLDSDDVSGVFQLSMIDVNDVETASDHMLIYTGSPHYIVFDDNVEDFDIKRVGRKIRYSDTYAKTGGVNVNVVQILSDSQIKVRTYERGVEDETLACGTGAVAATIATAIKLHSEKRKFTVNVQGGKLGVSFQSDDFKSFTDVMLQGEARKVFSGNIEMPLIF